MAGCPTSATHMMSTSMPPAPLPETFLSFEGVIDGLDMPPSVRITADGMIFAVDLVMAFTGKNRNEAGEVLRKTLEGHSQPSKILEKSFCGKGNGRTKLVTFEHAIELIMVLPGKVAKETRAKFADIIRRYMAGDESLVKEVRANAEQHYLKLKFKDFESAEQALYTLLKAGHKALVREHLLDFPMQHAPFKLVRLAHGSGWEDWHARSRECFQRFVQAGSVLPHPQAEEADAPELVLLRNLWCELQAVALAAHLRGDLTRNRKL